jgi:tetratricopeptide (TPR) repeat protein
VRALLGAYFRTMAGVIEAWGGTVEKYIGDAIMAVFGVPTVREDDASRALQAALDMRERLVELNRQLLRDHGVTLEIRTGVNTGEVVAPTGDAPTQRIVAGDAVNVAARLEQVAEPGTILVGERTHSATGTGFEFDPPMDVSLKGKPEPMRAYRLQAARTESTRGIPGLRAPMVGRDAELASLLAGLDESIATGRSRLVIVYGPAGIGKSRLAAEFVAAARERDDTVRTLRGRCLAAGRGITYWALAEILRGACGIGLDDPPEVVADKLRDGVSAVLTPLGLSNGDVQQTAQALATTIGVRLDDEAEPSSADALARAWPRFASGYAAVSPAIWIIEDLHWAGDPALEMIERIAARTDGPLLILSTARPEFVEAHPGFGAAGGAPPTSISLRPLTDQQGGELVEGLLAVAELPEALRAEILAKAEGNPFFVEEIVRRLIDEGALVQDGARWRATSTALSARIPDSIYALLAARIDALEPRDRHVAQEAAVIGRTFWAAAVGHAIPDNGVEGSLAVLERKGLISVRPTSSLGGQDEYAFRHALVRDVAYGSLPKARRARAHAQAAEWVAALAGDRTDEFAELIAYHYELAIAGEDADLAWLDDPVARDRVHAAAFNAMLVAGRAMRRRYAIDRAVELHERAVSLAATDTERLDAREQVGRDHDAAFHGEAAVEAYGKAIDIARQDPDLRHRLATLARRVGSLVSLRGGSFQETPPLEPTDALLQEGLQAVEEPRERAALLIALAEMGPRWTAANMQDPLGAERRMAAAREARAIANELGDPVLAYSVANTFADLYTVNGDYDGALRESRDAVPLIGQMPAPSQRAAALHQAAQTLLDLGDDPRTGLELAEQSHELSRNMSAHDRMHATAMIMSAGERLGDWDRVEAALDEHLADFAQESGVRCFAVQSGPSVGALVVANRGDAERARKLLDLPQPFDLTPGAIQASMADALVAAGRAEEGLDLARDVLARAPRSRWPWAVQAVIHALEAQEDWEALARLVEEVSDLRGASGYLGALLFRAEGETLVANGKPEAGAALLRDGLAEFERMAMPFEAARTREALAKVAGGDECRDLLAAALATYESLRARPHADRVKAALAANRADA